MSSLTQRGRIKMARNAKVRGLSDILTYFRRNETPIFFVSLRRKYVRMSDKPRTLAFLAIFVRPRCVKLTIENVKPIL